MKRLLLLIVLCMFMFTLVPAPEWDNYYNYDSDTKTATFRNGLTFGSKIAEIRLNTPQTYKARIGKDSMIFELEIWGEVDYSDFVKGMYVHNIKKGMAQENRDITLRYFNGYYNHTYDAYGCIGDITYDENNISQCSQRGIIGERGEMREKWDLLTPRHLRENDHLRVRGYTEVKANDYHEWYIDFFGAGKDTGFGTKGVKEWAAWTDDLNDQLLAYYKFDGDVLDELGNFDGTNQGTTNASGLVNWSRAYSGVNQYIRVSSFNQELDAYSIVFSLNWDDVGTSNTQMITEDKDGLGEMLIHTAGGGTDGLRFSMNASDGGSWDNGGVISAGWNHFIYTWDGVNNATLYKNGSSIATTSSYTWSNVTIDAFNFGIRGTSSLDLDGRLDEIALYSRALTTEEAVYLYDSGNITTYGPVGSAAPNITYNSPASQNFTTSPQNIQFNITCWDDINLTECNLYINGVLNQTNSSGLNDTNYLFDVALTDGTYNVFGRAVDNDSQQKDTAARRFIIDSISPNITIDAPTGVYDYLDQDYELNLNYTINESNLIWTSYYYNRSFNATLNETKAVTLGSGSRAFYFENNTITTNTGDVSFGYNLGQNFHTLTTSVLDNVGTWTTALSNPNCYEQTFNSPDVRLSTNIGNYVCVQLNDNTQRIMNITGNNSFEWDYNRIYLNETQNTTFDFNIDKRNVTIFARDHLNNTESESALISTKSIITDEGYSDVVVEGSLETFYLTVDVNSSFTIDDAKLVYNDTLYEATFNIANNTYNLSYELTIPSVDTNTNVTFFWLYDLSDGTQINYTEHNQTISNLNIDDCSLYNITLFNLSLYEERSTDNLTGDMRVDIDIFNEDRSVNVIEYSNDFNNTDNALICLEEDLGSSTFSMDTVIQYEADGYVTELYNYYNFTLVNSSLPQVVGLYDLNSSYATEFLITYKDESFLPVDKALINIQRKYVDEGVFRVIELPLTDRFGQTTASFDTEKGIYTITVTKNGQTVASFDEVTVICQDALLGDCDLNLNSLSASTSGADWDNYEGVSFNTQFDPATRTVTKRFTSTDGSVKTVTFTAYKSDAYLNTLACNETLRSASGTLTCTVSDSLGNISITGETYVDNVFVQRDQYRLDVDPFDIYGYDAYVLTLMLMLTIPLMFISSSVGVVVGAIMGLVLATSLNIFVAGSLFGTVSSIMWLIIAGGIIIWKINQRL